MAKLRTGIIAAVLFCLFTISIARATPQLDDAAATTVQVALPLSDADPALRLPSEPVSTEADAKANTETDPNFAVVSAVPLTEITFRPVNRRFHVKRPCRHQFKFYPTMRESEPIRYGNDMILASGENSDFEQPIVRGSRKRIPGRWMRTHHRHHLRHRRGEDTDSDSDNEEEEDRVKKVVFKRYDYDRFDREKKLKLLRQHFRIGNEKRKEEKPKKAGFMKGVRKFLDHYF